MRVLATMTKNELVIFEKFRQLYRDHGQKTPMFINSKCVQCGAGVELEVHWTAGGFGMNGGALYADTDGQLFAKCPRCHKQKIS